MDTGPQDPSPNSSLCSGPRESDPGRVCAKAVPPVHAPNWFDSGQHALNGIVGNVVQPGAALGVRIIAGVQVHRQRAGKLTWAFSVAWEMRMPDYFFDAYVSMSIHHGQGLGHDQDHAHVANSCLSGLDTVPAKVIIIPLKIGGALLKTSMGGKDKPPF
eukprot:1148576-Pelagomonas_calceolata.AAC.4